MKDQLWTCPNGVNIEVSLLYACPAFNFYHPNRALKVFLDA
jgi:hypothetical protein